MTTTQKARIERELQRCTDLLVRHYQPERILLFGSLTTGAVHPYSDIDLIVIKETDQPFWERLLEVHRLLQPEVPLDLFVYTPEEWQEMRTRLFFREEVLQKSQVLYDANAARS